MSTYDPNVKIKENLIGLPGGKSDEMPDQNAANKRWSGNFLPPLALATTVIALGGSVAVAGVVKAAEGIFSGSSQSGPTIEQLRTAPHHVDVTPVTQGA